MRKVVMLSVIGLVSEAETKTVNPVTEYHY